MTIYGQYNREKSTLQIRTDGIYSNWEWINLMKVKNSAEAKKEFFKEKERSHWTSKILWLG